MPYDDDGLAAKARVEALEEQLREKEAEVARFKAEHPGTSAETKPALDPPTPRQRVSRKRTSPLLTVVGWLVVGLLVYAGVRKDRADRAAMPPMRLDSPSSEEMCVCMFGDQQSSPAVVLAVYSPGYGLGPGLSGWSLSDQNLFGHTRTGYVKPFPPGDGRVLPPSGDAPRMGIACDTGVLVLVADRRATAWSLDPEVEWMWNKTLPSPWVGRDRVPAGRHPRCPNLQVEDGVATLELADGRHALSLKDGALR